MKHKVLAIIAAAGVSVFGSTVATAAPITVSVCKGAACWAGSSVFQDGVVVNWANVQAMTMGNATSAAAWGRNNSFTLDNWSISMDSDPFVTNIFALTNNLPVTQTFSFETTIGISPAIPVGLMRGSIAVTLTDNNGDGATLATSGAPIYQGKIDGNVARTLWDPTTTVSTLSSIGDSIDFGFPTRENAPESIDSTISLLITFSLSPGDSASFTSNFDVTPIPLPPAIWLFGSALLGLAGVARRRKAR